MCLLKALILFLCFPLILQFAISIEDTSTNEPPGTTEEQAQAGETSSDPPSVTTDEVTVVNLMSSREFWLALIILVFGVLMILIQTYLFKGVVHSSVEEISRTFTVTLIIIGTLVLIASGFSSQQIAPALGLFGTIAGYLLGRSHRGMPKEEGEKNDRKEIQP